MGRRRLLFALLTSCIFPLAVIAQQNRVWRVGELIEGSPGADVNDASLKLRLRELGYVEGRDYIWEYRFASLDFARLPILASELVAQGFGLIVVRTTSAALAARGATQVIPIVLVGTADPVGSRLVASLSHPGGNITGVTSQAADIAPKRLDLLRQLTPGMRRIGFLYDPTNVSDQLSRAQMESACKELGWRLINAPVTNPEGFVKAFADLKREQAQGLIASNVAVVVYSRHQIIELAAKQKLPTMFGSGLYVDSGGLISYGPNRTDVDRRSADYIAKIFNGAKPSDLPVEQPTKFELVVNRKTSRALGLSIPQSILITADRVVE